VIDRDPLISFLREGTAEASSPRDTPAQCKGGCVKRRFLERLVALGVDTRCAADLLRYFQRHPTVYVTTDQLAACVGYAPDHIEAGILTLTRAGLLVQRRQPGLTAALYRLVAEAWLSELVRAASSASGRRQLRRVLRSHELCRRAAAANGRAEANLHRSDRLLRTVHLTPRADS